MSFRQYIQQNPWTKHAKFLAICSGLCMVAAIASAEETAKSAHQKTSPVGTQPTTNGCLELVDAHCKNLYKKKELSLRNSNKSNPAEIKFSSMGNQDLFIGDQLNRIRLGSDEKGIPYALRLALERRLETREQIPADLRRELEKQGYFEAVQNFLAKADLTKRTHANALAFGKLYAPISEKFADAWNATLIQRTENPTQYGKGFPGFSSKEDPPVEEWFYYDQMDEKLEEELSLATWGKSPQWEQVLKQFDEVKLHFIEYLKQKKGVSPKTLEAWIAKLRSVEPKIPDGREGSACDTTLSNAFYMPSENKLTICAGLFNSLDDVRLILAHELAHAIDPMTQYYDLGMNSKLGKRLAEIKKEVCTNAPMSSCPKSFSKDHGADGLIALAAENRNVHPPMGPDSFYECLRNRKDLTEASPELIASFAQKADSLARAQAADSHRLLYLSKSESPNEAGDPAKNPHYLNPCGRETAKAKVHEIESEYETAFVAAYLCTQSSDPATRMKEADDTASRIMTAIHLSKMQQEKSFSLNDDMLVGGHSTNNRERFADSLAAGVYAHWLNAKNQKSVSDRRQQTLAGISYFCNPPSLLTMYPKEAAVEKSLSFEQHSIANTRIAEILGQEMRVALDCSKDFEGTDCVL